MDNQDKTTFSLDDDEIVEEEFIERDEEYDDGYEDEEEEYEDENYDDEDYDDEDYDDEEYDGDYDEEEDYDDGYNDDYYDDRLNKVLDELAELKRSMVPAAPAQQYPPQPIMPPQYIYQPTAPPAGSEVVMYNEISRLRDELSRNQSSLEMQKELTRIKEDMQRDQRFAEAQYTAEIQRLQSKIDDLLKNAYGPQGEIAGEEQPVRIEGGKSTSSLDIDKLLSINEAILRAMRESDARLQGEIAQLKKQLEEMPSAKELGGAVSAVKKAANSFDGGLTSEGLAKLSADLTALKAALENAGGVPVQQTSLSAPVAVAPAAQAGDVSSAELLRQLYDIKTAIGSSSEAALKRAQTVSELIGDYKKVKFDVLSHSLSYKEKLDSVYAFIEKLTESNEPDAFELAPAVDELIATLEGVALDKRVFEDLASFCSEHSMTDITSEMRDSASRFFKLAKKVGDAKLQSLGDYLSDIVTEINMLESNRHEADNAALVGEITTAMLEEDPKEQAVREMIAELINVTVGDVAVLPRVEMPHIYKSSRFADEENIFTVLTELRNALAEHTPAQSYSEGDKDTEHVARHAEPAEQAELDGDAAAQILYAIDELKSVCASSTGNEDFAEALEELRNNYVDITNRIVDISEKLQEPITVEGGAEAAISDEERQIMLDDLGYIRAKLDDYENLFNGIADLRNDLQSMDGSSSELSDQTGTLLSELTTQFDKLYEDLSNVILESEANIIARLGEGGGVVEGSSEAIETAKADILSETQAIRDSLALLQDTMLTLPVADAVEQLRNDLNAFIGLVNNNTDISSADRQKLLDDVAYLREQAELAAADSGKIPDGASAVEDSEKLVAYLDEIAARVTLIATVAEDTTATRDAVAGILESVTTVTDTLALLNDNVAIVSDNIATVNDNVTAVSESMASVSETVSAVNDGLASVNEGFGALNDNITSVGDSVTAMSDSIAAIGETVAPLIDDVSATRNAATAALDALQPISDQLNTILDRLSTATVAEEYVEETADEHTEDFAVSDDLAEIKEDLTTILDNLALMPQGDDVVAARDNTAAILDTLALVPHAEDVITTRDNVAALLDSVNTLTESINAVMATQDNGAVVDELALIREQIDAQVEDVKFIRQKLEEVPQEQEGDETLSTIKQDIEQVLERIETYEQLSEQNKQEIIDTVNGIREEIHINALDENMTAQGLDGETREGLIAEIAEIRERLGNIETATQNVSDNNTAALDSLTTQLTDLQVMLQDIANGAVSDGSGAMDGDTMQALVDELAAIREKLDAAPEYDTVEEILSLREDIKAARIVDQEEVAGELESIKNELMSISSGNILDEIRALREDISNLSAGDGTVPTDGEINLVFNEIVSLRDEVFAFKDEVLNATGLTEQPQEVVDGEEQVETSDDIATILDELTALREDQTLLTGSVEELKDIVSRRTSLGGEAVDGEETGETVSVGEFDVVLDEIINLKNDIARIEDSVGGERLTAISEQVEELRALVEELHGVQTDETDENGETQTVVQDVAVDLTPVMEQFYAVNAALDEIRMLQETPVESVGDNGSLDELRGEIAEIKAAIAGMAPVDYADELASMRAEIEALRAENEQLKAEGNDSVSAQIAELKDFIREMSFGTPATTTDGDSSYATLIDELRQVKEQLAVQPAPAALDEQTIQEIRDALGAQSDQRALTSELNEIRDEIAQLRSLTTVTAESDGISGLAELRDELAELKSLITSGDSLQGVAEDVSAIKADVQILKDEPDLGVMSEILALRDEFQALREQIEEVKRVAGATDKESDESLMTEVQSLRDQLFAISMANVNDPSSGESNYESYNNIILDEIASLRDQIGAASTNSDLDAVSDELEQLKELLERREDMYDELAARVERLGNDATNNRILEELASLRTDMENQRDADLTTLNFMSEMAHLLERQNQYLTQNAGNKISDEIESLRSEIASSDAVAEEVAKLREVMSQSGSASDNETILQELASLREELSREKPSRENVLILDAIERLRDEITVLAEREAGAINSDEALSDSLSDLREQLEEIAGIVEPAPKSEPEPIVIEPEKKPTSRTGAKRGRKPGQKNGTGAGKSSSTSAGKTSSTATAKTSGTGAKRGRKPAQKQQPQSESAENHVVEVAEHIVSTHTNDIESIIEQQASMLGGNGAMGLDPKGPTTHDAMDLADRLAKQVANKLIMEQLVEQLGDGGVSEDRVDEILRDILPQEFTTIAETEASDKVRRLANQLVLDKLRARLNGKNTDED